MGISDGPSGQAGGKAEDSTVEVTRAAINCHSVIRSRIRSGRTDHWDTGRYRHTTPLHKFPSPLAGEGGARARKGVGG